MDFANDLILGRGKLYFDRFTDGTLTKTGERFFGNVPSIQLAQAVTKLDHYDSTQGLKQKDKSLILQNDQTITFGPDNVDKDNLALWFLGTTADTIVAAAGALTDNVTAKLGTFIQLGVDADHPAGQRNLGTLVVTAGATPVDAAGNFEFDAINGRVYIEPDSPDITDGDALVITSMTTAGTDTSIIAAGLQIFGALRFISANPVGTQKNYYWPYVCMSPSGNVDLIADTFQTLTFSADVLKLDSNTETTYISQG